MYLKEGYPMKSINFAAMAILSVSATAQVNSNITPLTDVDKITVEVSRNVAVGWSGNSWSNYRLSSEPLSIRRQTTEMHTLSNAGFALTFDTGSFFQMIGNTSNLVTDKSSSRESKPLAAGQSWKAKIVYTGQPASWCPSTLETKFDSSFEVQQAEKINLKINGQDTTLDVLPVLEKGWWNRCVSGKRLVRSLYSPALDAVVSLEFLSYNPQGQVHEVSFRYNFKEINRP
jgi:hypothetical protein